jgi:hypothetical protein
VTNLLSDRQRAEVSGDVLADLKPEGFSDPHSRGAAEAAENE